MHTIETLAARAPLAHLVLREVAHVARGVARPELPGGHQAPGRQHAARREHAVALHQAALQEDAAVAHDALVLDRRRAQQAALAHRAVAPDHRRGREPRRGCPACMHAPCPMWYFAAERSL